MVCPYCSADMEPIELNGKVFCSNCGLTVANNSPVPTPQAVINPEPAVVSEVETETPEEVPFSIIPEVTEEPADVITEMENAPRKLDVITEELPEPAETMNPITEAAENDLGLTEKTEGPAFESKIADLTIPSEEDFSMATPENNINTESYIELESTGDEKTTLEASGILLDILGDENKQNNYSSNDSEKLETGSSHEVRTIDPILEPEIPAKTETEEKDDDIYTLPSEVKVGLANKKVKKQSEPETITLDTKTEKKIEKLEEKLDDLTEPEVKLTPEEAEQYDPDTIDIADIDPGANKGKIIKEYFSTAIERDKETKKTKKKSARKKNRIRVFVFIFAGLGAMAALIVTGYFTYRYFQPTTTAEQVQEPAKFDTLMPSVIPPGYVLTGSKYFNENQLFEIYYSFADDEKRTIIYKQVKTDNGSKYISDYLLSNNVSFVEKKVNDTTFTEVNKTNLLWSNSEFVFVIESGNFDLSNELLYKMAESVEL